jgi:hypothetical protein
MLSQKNFFYRGIIPMKSLNKTFINIMMMLSVLGLIAAGANAGELIVNGGNPRFSVSAKTIKNAVTHLGHQVTEYKDAHGNPHFVFDKTVENVKDIAIFTADCGSAGCTDVVLYADFGVVKKITTEHINGWNHVSNLKRSKAFRSGSISSDGDVGLSMAVSFLDDGEEDKLAMQIGLFLVEVGMFSTLIDHVEPAK